MGFSHVLDLDGHWHLEQVERLTRRTAGRGTGGALLEATHDELARHGGPRGHPAHLRRRAVERPVLRPARLCRLHPLPAWLEPMRETEQRMELERHGRRLAMVLRPHRPLTLAGRG